MPLFLLRSFVSASLSRRFSANSITAIVLDERREADITTLQLNHDSGTGSRLSIPFRVVLTVEKKHRFCVPGAKLGDRLISVSPCPLPVTENSSRKSVLSRGPRVVARAWNFSYPSCQPVYSPCLRPSLRFR